MINALASLNRLRKGNQRFVSGGRDHATSTVRTSPAELLSGQAPFAIILGCSDSRVPVEIVFDQGFGDLFVIRVAGNVVSPSLIGSVEFAATVLGTRLAVVMGHSSCGAIEKTIELFQGPAGTLSPNVQGIVDRIRPAVEPLVMTAPTPEALMEQAVRANVRASADHLRHGSAVLGDLIRDDRLLVVGAEYSLETGVVDFFDGVPSDQPGPAAACE